MPKRARVLFALAAVILAVAVVLWQQRTVKIDRPTAEARATRLLTAYLADSDDPPTHFGPAKIIDYDDGWEFTWAYRPCADIAALRVFIANSGTASYAQLPDCNPQRGFAARPRRI